MWPIFFVHYRIRVQNRYNFFWHIYTHIRPTYLQYEVGMGVSIVTKQSLDMCICVGTNSQIAVVEDTGKPALYPVSLSAVHITCNS